VGAGPAGSSAALEASRQNLRVLMIDRKAVIGRPVQCAEYIPAPLVGLLNLGRKFVVQSVSGMKTFLFNRQVKETRAPGFVIRRDVFDQALAEAARLNGADIHLSTKAISLNGGEVLIKNGKRPLEAIKARVIIGADGPQSTVAGWIDSSNRRLIPAVQVCVPLKRKLTCTEIYFDREIYAGYAWLFPKGETANLGLGIKKRNAAPPPLAGLLERFMKQRAEEGKIENAPADLITGWIPADAPREIVRNNIILAGDAAGHTHPITGAGIFPAITAGKMAGKWAARAAESNNPGLLQKYQAEYRDLFCDSMTRAFKRRQLLEDKWEQLEEIFKHCWIAFKEYHAAS
jgi:geranylgeranyl reductase family protein